jgi:hypothetical protein
VTKWGAKIWDKSTSKDILQFTAIPLKLDDLVSPKRFEIATSQQLNRTAVIEFIFTTDGQNRTTSKSLSVIEYANARVLSYDDYKNERGNRLVQLVI